MSAWHAGDEPLWIPADERHPVARAWDAAGSIDECRREMKRQGEIRRDAVRELRAAGWTLARIAKELGITRQQVHRIGAGREDV